MLAGIRLSGSTMPIEIELGSAWSSSEPPVQPAANKAMAATPAAICQEPFPRMWRISFAGLTGDV
jgi:hypothetical protein